MAGGFLCSFDCTNDNSCFETSNLIGKGGEITMDGALATITTAQIWGNVTSLLGSPVVVLGIGVGVGVIIFRKLVGVFKKSAK